MTALDVKCETCGAEPGHRCENQYGREYRYFAGQPSFHRPREIAALLARIGQQQSERAAS